MLLYCTCWSTWWSLKEAVSVGDGKVWETSQKNVPGPLHHILTQVVQGMTEHQLNTGPYETSGHLRATVVLDFQLLRINSYSWCLCWCRVFLICFASPASFYPSIEDLLSLQMQESNVVRGSRHTGERFSTLTIQWSSTRRQKPWWLCLDTGVQRTHQLFHFYWDGIIVPWEEGNFVLKSVRILGKQKMIKLGRKNKVLMVLSGTSAIAHLGSIWWH